ncbi:spore coat protein [Lawsonibacter sp. OA9]|uniref:spore coat protein n=1 Tax=Oscillospiraceae TaxID=216572 RepID=UPI001F051379|nr:MULTISPECIES: spore coat protein [Oscillospiraceae]MCH1978279.1 spore coat protein [Lawsonibacter sp. OA9]MCH1981829.1 spore coat protein [Ruminococcus sp. OA3]
MNEKAMVTDTLVGINGELTSFEGYIVQTENPQLKQTLKQLRNECEMAQEKMYQAARQHNYYVPAQKATQEEVQHVKSILTQPASQSATHLM